MKKTKFIVTADLHLTNKGARFQGRRLEFGAAILETLFKAATKNKCAILIAGDIFDRSAPQPLVVKLLRDMLRKYKKIQMYCISGNHDRSSGLLEDTALINIDTKNFHLVDCETVKIDGIKISGLPYVGEKSRFQLLVSHKRTKADIVLTHQHPHRHPKAYKVLTQRTTVVLNGHNHEHSDRNGVVTVGAPMRMKSNDDYQPSYLVLSINADGYKFKRVNLPNYFGEVLVEDTAPVAAQVEVPDVVCCNPTQNDHDLLIDYCTKTKAPPLMRAMVSEIAPENFDDLPF